MNYNININNMNFLNEYCLKRDIKLTDREITKFQIYHDFMLEYNQKVNLTAITDSKEIQLKHFYDSLTLKKYLDKKNFGVKKNIIDIGAGAGFPSIPNAIVTDNNFTLVDSLNKRVKFLDELSTRLELDNVTNIHARAEELSRDDNYREQFDFCIARAVANLKILSEYCLPYVKVGGYFLALKGSGYKDEVENSKSMIEQLGAVVEDIEEIEFDENDHSIIVIKKNEPTDMKYPRKQSIIKKGN